MTSEVDPLKTNELLHRRKLRLQQVREQSKDIAKKIRQRAKVETLRQVKGIGSKREKEYLECQKEFINKLQELYTNGLQNIGTGHKNASGDFHQDVEKKIDKSKLRGKEAVAEVRRKKQEILNKKQELLDRKLLAREAANELSREKSNIIAKTVQTKTKGTDVANDNKELNDSQTEKNLTEAVRKVDMATQLHLNDPMCDVETEIPVLVLPENESNRDPENNPLENIDKNKKPNLFALSDEMPSSLRGGVSTNHQVNQTKPSLTLISEYIQNRRLRLRESETKCTKKQTEDLQSIRQTIHRTRASKLEGSHFDNVCQVVDDQVFSVPTWKAESNYQFCNQNYIKPIFPPINSRKFKSIINSSINNTKNTARSFKIDLFQDNGACTFVPSNIHRTFKQSGDGKEKENTNKTITTDTVRKEPIIMYNHTSRNVRTLPSCNEGTVIRDQAVGENAFSKAQKEEINCDFKQKDLQNKIMERRNKVALTKEHVDKEYRDTLAFLNSIPKDMSNKPIKEAFMDEERLRELKETRQRKLQNEFKNIEREHRRHKCKHVKTNIQSRSKSPHNKYVDASHENNDFQYSWMPVPEREEHLTIHNIPTSGRNGNTVKFSNENDYHEYRSGHKHTPPTKDISNKSRASKKKYVEAVVIEQNSAESTECSSIASDSSSFEDLMLKKKGKKDVNPDEVDDKLSNTDRIIIYKIHNAKNNKKTKCHKKSKLVNENNLTKSTQEFIGECLGNGDNKKTAQKVHKCEDKSSFEQLTEGIYKTVNGNGDNMNTLQFRDSQSESNLPNSGNFTQYKNCNHLDANFQDVRIENIPSGGGISERLPHKCNCTSYKNNSELQTIHYPSAATSTSTVRATINKDRTVASDPDYLKLIDQTGQENGKFYVGTTGFLKDEAYEVVIQLRKKEKNNKEEEKSKEKHDAKISLKKLDANNMHTDSEKNEIVQESKEGPEVKEPITLSKISTPPSKRTDKQISSVAENETLQNATSENENAGISNKSDDNNNQNMPPEYNKKATSTYTQTTNSPIHRPVYMHMSSSTSTTYMSPPEIIMPRFLKRDYSLSCENTHNNSIKEIRHLQNFASPKSCRCKHHYINKKDISHSNNVLNNYKKCNHHSATPPNTASSALSDIYNKYESSPVSFESEKLGTCSKCRKHKKVNKKTDIHKRHKDTPPLRTANAPSKHMKKNKSNERNKNNKTAIHPVVKDYVNKLLELNKEGMKAVDIINEECSSVTTPSSSIINDPFNMNAKISNKKISLEQIKNIIKQKIMNEIKINEISKSAQAPVDNQIHKRFKALPKLPRRKPLHKVKSLNISKNVLKMAKPREFHEKPHEITSLKLNSTSSSLKNDTSDQADTSVSKVCSQRHSEPLQKSGISVKRQNSSQNCTKERSNISLSSTCTSATVPVSTNYKKINHNNHDSIDHPLTHISTQTTSDSENNFMKVAEDKLQNMEKIADLTEKCTKRLSNLAKVLEEVRKNKSLAYSQITSSESTSDSDSERNKQKAVDKNLSPLVIFPEMQSPINRLSPSIITSGEEKKTNTSNEKRFIPLLSDIPKPLDFKTPSPPPVVSKPETSSSYKDHVTSVDLEKLSVENMQMKIRGKPPPALSRIHLKNEQEPIIPHELSTVLEVDSPMSLKLKSQSRNDVNDDVLNNSSKSLDHLTYKRDYDSKTSSPILVREYIEPDLDKLNKASKRNIKTVSSDTTDDTKLKMMDLKQFNEIMLKPFISIQEYAKKQYMETHEGTSNNEDHLKGALITDDMSSFHSEGSLPDVIAELLKRNIISEPFKFDSPSNVNSSTISSESTISLLALSNMGQKRSGVLFQTKKNVAETSDTLSISSNPDLENAFQKLGMGWASSTLKKTKERLALSSSSNTSSSSGVQLRNKIFNNQPANADSNSLLTNGVKSPRLDVKADEPSKNDKKKAILSNTMTVKEFLTNELAKKITFNNKSTKNTSDSEFVSLYETKMPEQMKQQCEADKSDDSTNNCTTNRARTSTPVQIFKSTTFQSSSSSNTSNGLFSNVDDLSSVKVTSNSIRNHSTTDKDDLTIPNYILKVTKQTECSKSD